MRHLYRVLVGPASFFQKAKSAPGLSTMSVWLTVDVIEIDRKPSRKNIVLLAGPYKLSTISAYCSEKQAVFNNPFPMKAITGIQISSFIYMSGVF